MHTRQLISVFIALLTSTMTMTISASEPTPTPQPTLQERLKQPWRTIRIGHALFSSCDTYSGPTLVFQRDEAHQQILFSYTPWHRLADRALPIFHSALTEEQVSALLMEALDCYTQAGKEMEAQPPKPKPDPKKQSPLGVDIAQVEISILSPTSDHIASFDCRFVPDSKAQNAFYQFTSRITSAH